MKLLALTGGTGFVGANLIERALAAGHHVRALTRKPQATRANVTWVRGDLADADGLDRLMTGAEAVIHVAGVINAPDRAGFEAGNVGGTLAVARAARKAGVRRFVHVSSLAAREPGLSDYGRSKARSERAMAASGLDWTIVRPPAVYGPGDRETLEFFRMARRGIFALPPQGRLSLIAAPDLCDLMLALLDAPDTIGATYEPDDGRAGGWTHRDFAEAIGRAMGRRVRTLALPAPMVRAGAWADGLVRRGRAKLTPDRARYLCHPDWVADPARHVPAALWRAQVATPEGLRMTAEWYRRAGWL